MANKIKYGGNAFSSYDEETGITHIFQDKHTTKKTVNVPGNKGEKVSTGGGATKNTDGTYNFNYGNKKKDVISTSFGKDFSAEDFANARKGGGKGNSPLKEQTFTPQKVEAFNVNVGEDPKGTITNPDITEVKLDKPIKVPGKTLTPTEELLKSSADASDKELIENKKTYDKDVDKFYDNYNLAKGDFLKNKGNYSNFDDVSKEFDTIQETLRNAQKEKGADLTSEDYKRLALELGVDENDLTNPKNIFNKLKLTEEGKISTGKDKFDENMSDAEISFNRAKEDMETKLGYTKTDIKNQMDSVEEQIKSNIAFATAQGAWMGGLKSSGYQQGLDNIRAGGDEILKKLQTSLDRTETGNTTNLERLTEDYQKGVSRATAEMNRELDTIKQNAGLYLVGKEEEFGMGSELMTKTLKDMAQNFNQMNLDTIQKYTSTVDGINKAISYKQQEVERLEEKANEELNKRFTEYTANNGVLLENTSLLNLSEEVKSGIMSVQKYKDLKNYMITGISETLGKYGIVDTADLTKITGLLSQGKTPTEIVAEMRADEKFAPKEEVAEINYREFGGNLYKETPTGLELVEKGQGTTGVDEIKKVGDKTYVINKDGTYSDITNSGTTSTAGGTQTTPMDFIKSKEGFRDFVYDDMTGGIVKAGQKTVGTPTIGYGFTTVAGQKVRAGMSINDNGDILNENGQVMSNVDVEMQNQMDKHSTFMNKVKVPLSDSQKSALMSLEFNGGAGVWNYPAGKKMLEQINNGDFEGASKTLISSGMLTTESNTGKKLNGLVKRRKEEADLLLQGSTPVEDRGVIGSLGVPISYERQIKQMVPSTLMNSEIELSSLNETIQAMDKAGLPVEDAVLTYLGFNVTENNRGQAMDYVNVGRNLGEDLPDNFYATVSNYMDKGDNEKANKYVGNIVDDKAKTKYGEDFISKSNMNQMTRDVGRLNDLIKANPEKIGAFDGRVNDLMRKFKDYPEMQELQTILTMSQAGIRKHFAGSAVTPSEMVALEDYIGGNTKMTPNNLLTMLNTIQKRTNKLFLGQREEFGYKPLVKDKEGNVKTGNTGYIIGEGQQNEINLDIVEENKEYTKGLVPANTPQSGSLDKTYSLDDLEQSFNDGEELTEDEIAELSNY